jgi:hypothetical protein
MLTYGPAMAFQEGGKGKDGATVGGRVPAAPALLPAAARASRLTPMRPVVGLFTSEGPVDGVGRVRVDREQLLGTADAPGAMLVHGFPLTPGRLVDLEVERFWVTRPGTRFVAGGADGRDVPLAFDPDSVVLLRGRVAGYPHSNVYLGISDWVTNGVIDLGKGVGMFGVSSRGPGGTTLPPGMLAVFEARAGGPNPSPGCTVLEHGPTAPTGQIDLTPVKGLRQLELAVDTDYEFYQLFGDESATAAYLVELYGAVSDIYMRNINVRVDLTYARVWTQPNEPFAAGLNEFLAYWEGNMQSVHRDVAQMFSGRADLPGGVAYLSALCGDSAYGFCGNAVGYFADAVTASVLNYDPLVTAHELGHNCGTHHTDVYGIDNCNIVAATPQRGTIMSYCNQTVSGAMSVMELEFHKITRDKMLEHISSVSCVVLDCNQNGIADPLDIVAMTSADVNGNGIPDECEDCNHNSILDTIDIATSTSLDLNTNGIPDECEPDCNENGIPDDRDILLGTSQDLYGDAKPDECDEDRNNNNISDYNEIMANMTLDRDRDRILDATQDCDNDTVPNLVELEGARNAWVASLAGENTLREFHSVTGVLMGLSNPGRISGARDLIITADRRILVASSGANKIVEFDRTGAFVRDLVPAGSGGLSQPSGMVVAPWGNLLVASTGTNSVLEFDIASGGFVRAFVAAGSGGLAAPFGLVYKPSGNLFVSGMNSNTVYEYDRTTGAFVRVFVTAGSGTLSGARGMVFNPLTGNLLVASYNNDQVKEYNGSTGAFIRNWLVTGLPIDGPWGVRVGPDGFVYISRNNITDTHVTRARIFIHDPRNGNFVRAYVQSQDSGLINCTGFDFMPGDFADCNRNLVPDSCDIAGGLSTDINLNGTPDECERTCYANCDLSTVAPVLNVNDFQCFLNQYALGSVYANCDGSTLPPLLNVNDFICFQTKFAAGCP